MNLHNSLIPRIILRNVFGWRDGTVGVAGAPGAGVGQVLVGGEDGGPAVEAHHGRDEVHGGGGGREGRRGTQEVQRRRRVEDYGAAGHSFKC